MKRKLAAVLLSTALCVSMTAQAGAAAFDDGEASVPAVLDVSADPFTSGDTSIEETETEEPEITPGEEVSDPSQELETPSAEPGVTPSVTPIPDDTSEEPEDPDIEVFDPDAGIPDATPTPTPEPSVTPAEDPEEPGEVSSGACQGIGPQVRPPEEELAC